MYKAESGRQRPDTLNMKKTPYDIIIKFLDGTCTDEEYTAVMKWADSSSENQKELELLKKIYHTPEISQPDPDVDSAYTSVLERIRQLPEGKSADIYRMDSGSSGWKLKNIFLNPAYLRAALVLIGSIIILYFILNHGPSEANFVINVPNGEQKELSLPDGSLVTLDAGSTIIYSENFGNKTRDVQLEGEGFFNVVSNPDIPFNVYSNGSLVTVLGTKFNLRSWKSGEKTILAVEEGRVSFSNESEKNSEVIVLKGQMSEINEGGSPSVPESVNIKYYTSWRNREMYFQNVELSEVLNQLQRWYDVRIILPDKSYYTSRVTLNIKNTPLEENLEVLSLVMNFNYKIEGSVISFSRESQ